ncbi:hypothetical protein ACG7TL_006598 [Trametes sanguinea]
MDVRPSINANEPLTLPIERTSSLSQDARPPSDKLANSRLQTAAPKHANIQPQSPIVIDLDDVTDNVVSQPSSTVAVPTQRSRPTDRATTSEIETPSNPGLHAAPSAAEPSSPPDHAHRDAQTALDKPTRVPQKRDQDDTHSGFPASLPQKPRTRELPEPLHPRGTGSRQSGRRGYVPPADQRLRPLPVPAPAQPSRPSAYNANDLRELISDLRAKGKLAPPPTIDYVLERPSSSMHLSVRAANLGRNPVAMRSETRDLEEVERKLEDDDEDGMDVDRSEPLPQPQDEREPSNLDPHNIDDLYGDIAPPYRDQPPPAPPPRVQRAPATYNHLLFAIQARRYAEDDTPTGATGPEGGTESRRSRKRLAQELQGSALRDKQAAGVQFAMGYRGLDGD